MFIAFPLLLEEAAVLELRTRMLVRNTLALSVPMSGVTHQRHGLLSSLGGVRKQSFSYVTSLRSLTEVKARTKRCLSVVVGTAGHTVATKRLC